jgi:site-specific DNA-methyltransferase (adenine-specific)
MLEVCEKELSHLTPWEDNPRVNDHAVDSVARSIDTFGFNVPILCDQNFTIIAGHTRWKAAKKLSLATVPVIVLKMTDVERQAFALADNKTAEIADWDFPKLREILNELSSEDMNLQDLGFGESELVALLSDEEEPDWTEFDNRLAALENHSFALLPIKVPREAKRPIQEALRARAVEIGIDEKDKAVLAGRVIRKLLGVY